MRRHKDWPAEKTAPGDLGLVVDFVNTVDFETDEETLTSPQDLATWLAQHRLLEDGAELGNEDLEQALVVRRGLRAPRTCARPWTGSPKRAGWPRQRC